MGKWIKGQSGNAKGRPVGARNKLSEAFLTDLLADYEAHGQDAIERTRQEDPVQYLKLVASLVPREMNLTANNYDDLSDEQLVERIKALDTEIYEALYGDDEDESEANLVTTKTH